MRPVTTQFLASLRSSHVIASGCQLVFPDATTVDVPIEAGAVTIDRTAQTRRAGNVIIPWSLAQGQTLGVDLRTLTLGGYCRLSRGLRYADGSTELVDLGYLRVESVSWGTLEASAALEVADRMAQVRDEPFTTAYSAKGKRPHTAAIEIVQGVFGNAIAYHAPYQPADTLGDIIYTGDRGDALSDLEQAYDAETYFDAAGDFVFAQKPQDGATSVWTVDASTSGVMIDTRENLDRTGIYNGVLVTAQPDAEAPPITALAVYSVPTSPIRWGGPFGKVALLADSQTAATQAQALATAQSLLRLRLKQTRSLELTAAPNPALEAGDTIAVVFADGRSESHLIDAVTTDLATAPQTILTRTQDTPGASPVPAIDALFGQAVWRELVAS